METVDWKYCIDVKFDRPSVKPSGIKMYFSDFKIAVERMMTFGEIFDRDDTLFDRLAKNLSIVEMKLLSIKDGSVEMESRLEQNGFAERTPGLYYHFPKGITDFEKKSELSFAGYKGYDKRNAFVQTSYPDSNSTSYHDILAHQKMLEKQEQERKKNQYYAAIITKNFFKTAFPHRLEFYPEPFSEVYIHPDPNITLGKLLEIDFNQLDINVAYEAELQDVITDARIIGYYSFDKATLKSYRHPHGDRDIKTPGIYLDVSLDRDNKESLEFPNKVLEPLDQYKRIFKVGEYDELGVKAEKVAELLSFLSDTKQTNKLMNSDPQKKKRASLKNKFRKI
ncbi:hypothetical protein FXV77_05490 [Sphingobacterium phlebotomi]|uniref:Uncharacterized protein n=1 Tax=Sphingobacterium phlebotomi TaxID=2605433 RepID=A0A5D4H9Z6_9SPHI|nr:hypothetical protein [Sphingobacterium phlebotomi]TYR37458.1 hypothetical protein FXV77_05490 [Sphingobacterium phlebotomi]